MASRMTIDLNADIGEGFGPYRIGDDTAMLEVVTSANVACGFHAGDPGIMHATFATAKAKGVAIGAHPGFGDREHFGRRLLPHTQAEVEQLVAYQIGAACGVAALAGHRVTYAKAHGALGNWAAGDEGISRAIARAIRSVDRSLVCLAIAATWSEHGARAEGVPVACEIFADRAYRPDGTLVPRGEPGAVLHDPSAIAARVLAMLDQGAIIAVDGTQLKTTIDSICVHGDTPDAVAIARHLRGVLVASGQHLAAFAS
jgi:5-oxoprolinase (ATP-hydrolysing) subunit A